MEALPCCSLHLRTTKEPLPTLWCLFPGVPPLTFSLLFLLEFRFHWLKLLKDFAFKDGADCEAGVTRLNNLITTGTLACSLQRDGVVHVVDRDSCASSSAINALLLLYVLFLLSPVTLLRSRDAHAYAGVPRAQPRKSSTMIQPMLSAFFSR